jgi:ferritin-like metal-binding protein YciE
MPLQDVLINEMRDLYSAENQLVKALPKLAKGVESAELKELITTHLEETKGQVERLKQIFQDLGEKPTGKLCKGMQGVIEEGQEALEEDEEGPAFDLGIAGGSLRVEHYEIAGYTACIAMARALGMDDVAETLTETLNEEQATAQKILTMSEAMLQEAADNGEEEEDEEFEDVETEEEEGDDEEAGSSGKKKAAAKKSSAKKSSSSKKSSGKKGGR